MKKNSRILKQYEEYLDNQNDTISEEFNKIENFKTSIRGIKVRGTYDTRELLSGRVLQNIDPSFMYLLDKLVIEHGIRS